MTRKSPRNSPIILDWFNVTYRSIWLTTVLAVLALGGGGGWWYWKFYVQPQAAAEVAIDRATVHLAQAERTAADDRADEVRANAAAALDEARSRFGGAEYRAATLAAQRSSDLSLRAIDLARGHEGEPRLVHFFRIEGDVKVKLAGEFAWTSANPKMGLSKGDQIKTSSSGSTVLLYFDGTKTTVKPGSLLEIRDLYEDPLTKVRRVSEKLNWGAIEASTQKVNVSGSYHELATDSARAKADDEGEYRLEHREDSGRSAFSTFTGGALEIATAERKTVLAEGERVVATRDGGLSGKDLLPGVPRQVAPQDQKVFVTESVAGMEVSLGWSDVLGAARYRLMISSESLFTNPLYDAERAETRLPIDVGPGEYHWRVAAINAAGLEGRFSETRLFRVSNQRIRDDSDTTPPELEISDSVLTGNMLILSGRTESGATLWIDNERQEIDGAGAFYTVIRLRNEGWNDIVVVAQDAAGNEKRIVHRVHVDEY
jgi:hypothetical protein